MKAELFQHAVAPFLAVGALPECMFSRSHNEAWSVMGVPVGVQATAETGPAWRLVRDGDYVRVPLLPYLADNTPLAVAATVLDFACSVLPIARGRRCRFVLGDDVPQTEDGRLRIWIGFAYQE